MDQLTIRPYRRADREQCRSLWVELTQHHRKIYNDPAIGGDDPGRHFDEHLGRVGPENIWVADKDGTIIGLIGLILDDHEAEIEPIVVASAHRGQGIGQALIDYVIVAARRLGVRYLSVKPVARNQNAISFFYDAGFGTLGHIELFMDLRSSGRAQWKPGPELFGHPFEY